MRGVKKKNLIKRLHQNNWVSKCPPNPFKLRMSSFWMGRERILFVSCCWFKGFGLLNSVSSCSCRKNTYAGTRLHCGSYRPCSSICADLLILPSSLPSYSPVSLPEVPPVVQSITGISASYLRHCAVVTSHSISPHNHHTPCGAV